MLHNLTSYPGSNVCSLAHVCCSFTLETSPLYSGRVKTGVVVVFIFQTSMHMIIYSYTKSTTEIITSTVLKRHFLCTDVKGFPW